MDTAQRGSQPLTSSASAAYKSDDLWTPFKELSSVVEQHILRPNAASYDAFETALRKHRHNFLSLLKNPPTKASSRNEIKQGANTGVTLAGIGHTILPPQLVEETIIISDMFNLNEYLALELLCTAQRQMPRHPNLPRGLVAILLYYDGRKALVQALKCLVTARRGVSWSTDTSDEITDYVTSYTDRLVLDGIVPHILEVLETWDLNKEMELLQENRALGGPRHRRQVWKLMRETRGLLAGILVALAAQGGLQRESTAALISYLRRCNAETDAAGAIDDVTLALMMAFLYSIDLSVIHRRDDGEDLAQTLPILKDTKFVSTIGDELSQNRGSWECSGLQGVALLGWSLALAALRLAPTRTPIPVDDDDSLADTAITMKVFEYLQETFLLNKNIHREEFYMKRLHTLFTDFIVLMHSKVMDLRLKADEAARTAQQYAAEGLEPPAGLPRHFEALLLGIARLYSEDPLNLRLQYWITSENTASSLYRGSARGVSLVKFVRSAGELAPPRVMAPWARACAALAGGPGAAARAHALLHPPASPPPTLSWDHFFSSLNKYYSCLRQESPITGMNVSGIVAPIGGKKAVHPEEVARMRAALELLRSVAANDQAARHAICDNANWAAIQVIIGLIGCSIPIPLKADLILTLASLGMSPETSIYIWNSLESAQLIHTIPTTSNFHSCSLENELEDVEARNEEFPLSRALLQLFDALSTSGIPRTLGAGPRKPGFDPYLTFIINSVFLRFPNRSYKNTEEKWEIASLCLSLFEKFLNQYEPNSVDFPVPTQPNEMNPPPGFHVMLQMSIKTDFLRLILLILDESVSLFDTFQPFPGKKYLEACTLSCLNLIEKTLSLQHSFMAELAESSCSLLVTGLSKLLLDMNPRSGRPDHMLNIMKFVTYNTWLPKHSLAAVNITSTVASQPSASQQLISILTCDSVVKTEIRHGFVECLEAEDLYALEDQTKSVTIQTKEAIINLIQSCLCCAAPNLSHYLLGFDLNKDISKTAFHQPGIMNFPRTCLHSIIELLDSSISQDSDPNMASLQECSYRLLYFLCSKQSTMGPTLRYLRACNELLSRHVGLLKTPSINDPNGLGAAAWLLRLCAVELHITACERQTSHFTSLAKQLVDSPDKCEGGGALLRLLQSLFKSPPRPIEPNLKLLDGAALAAARNSCTIKSGNGRMITSLISIPRLRALLTAELAAPLRPAAPHRARLTHEIEEALSHAVALNQWERTCVAGSRLTEAWCCAAESLCCCARAPQAAPPLLRALLATPPPPPHSHTASATVLILLVSLRQGFNSERRHALLSHGAPNTSILNQYSMVSQNTLNLKFILQRILNWIVVSGSSSQKMRVNLYGAFLNMIRIANEKPLPKIEDADLDNTYVSRLDSTRDRITLNKDETVFKSAVVEAVNDCGDPLKGFISSDASGSSHEACQVAALACLAELVTLEISESWLQSLQTAGHLRNMIDSLRKDDPALRQVLDVMPKTLKVMFVYESKMTLLNKIASTHMGAELLLQQGTLTCLSNMQVFDCHPDIQASMSSSSRDFIPSVASRYRQILMPALALCDTLITTLGTENYSCLLQVTHFLLSHSETVEAILRAGSPSVPLGLLVELEAVTGVIARSSNQEIFGSVESDTALQESVVSVYRIQKLMLALFPRFTLSEALLRNMAECSKRMEVNGEVPEEETADRILTYFKIVCNLTTYARNIISNHGVDHRSLAVVFRPILSHGSLDRQGKWALGTADTSPHLGLLIQQLVNTVMHFNKEKQTLELIVRNLKNVPEMSVAELEELVSSDLIEGSITESRVTAYERLLTRVTDKKKELEYCRYVIDNCIFLIWAHLDFYLLRTLPVNGHGQDSEVSINKTAIMGPTEASLHSSTQDISDLKNGLVSVFNDTFCRQLIHTASDKSQTHKTFIEAMLRKVKSLLQFVPVN